MQKDHREAVTRFGMREPDMGGLAELLAAAIRGTNVRMQANRLRSEFVEMQFV